MKNEKITLSKNGEFSVGKLIEYFQTVLGVMLSPVKGQYNTYWLSARTVDGKRLEVVDGPKYYKLVFDEYGVEIVCNGMFNAYSMKSNIVQWIKEEVAARKVA
jgi:hypothetical protein